MLAKTSDDVLTSRNWWTNTFTLCSKSCPSSLRQRTSIISNYWGEMNTVPRSCGSVRSSITGSWHFRTCRASQSVALDLLTSEVSYSMVRSYCASCQPKDQTNEKKHNCTPTSVNPQDLNNVSFEPSLLYKHYRTTARQQMGCVTQSHTLTDKEAWYGDIPNMRASLMPRLLVAFFCWETLSMPSCVFHLHVIAPMLSK